MRETGKASRRRCKEASDGKFPWDDIFKGYGCDVGAGTDPLDTGKDEFGSVRCIPVDLPDGAGDSLIDFFQKDSATGKKEWPQPSFDFVHSSQCLEHAVDPKVMLQSWLDCLKPRGFVVASVPSWELYEKKQWPSKFNAGHRTRWTMDQQEALRVRREEPGKRDLILLPQWLEQFTVEVLLCRLIDTSDHSLDPSIDQTYKPEDNVEVFIEFVLRKRP